MKKLIIALVISENKKYDQFLMRLFLVNFFVLYFTRMVFAR